MYDMKAAAIRQSPIRKPSLSSKSLTVSSHLTLSPANPVINKDNISKGKYHTGQNKLGSCFINNPRSKHGKLFYYRLGETSVLQYLNETASSSTIGQFIILSWDISSRSLCIGVTCIIVQLTFEFVDKLNIINPWTFLQYSLLSIDLPETSLAALSNISSVCSAFLFNSSFWSCFSWYCFCNSAIFASTYKQTKTCIQSFCKFI